MISNISFKSNIHFVDKKTFDSEARHADTVWVEEMWDCSELKNIEQGQRGATKGIIFCLAGVFKDLSKKTNTIFHFYPPYLLDLENKPPKDLDEKLEKASYYKTKGILIGGMSKSEYPVEQLSLITINFLKKHFKKSGNSDFSIFFGQGKGSDNSDRKSTSFIYDPQKDTYYVNICKSNKDTFMRASVMDKEGIKEYFECIKISPNDKVFIGNIPVNSEELNQGWKESRKSYIV